MILSRSLVIALLCTAACSDATSPNGGIRGPERFYVEQKSIDLTPGRESWITVSTFELINPQRMESIVPDVTYTSSDPSVASVTLDATYGHVMAHKTGQAKITVQSRRDPSNVGTVTVNVTAAPVGNESGLVYSANVETVPTSHGPPNSLGPVDIRGTIIIRNPTSGERDLYISGCNAILLYAQSTYTGTPVNPWPRRGQCQSTTQHLVLTPGEADTIPVDFRLTLAGGEFPSGRFYAQATIDRVRDILAVPAGAVDLPNPIGGLTFAATTAIANGELQPRVSFTNTNDKVMRLEFGACSVDLLAFKTAARTGTPVWNSAYRQPVGSNGNLFYSCPAYLRIGTIAPGETQSPGEYNPRFPIGEMLADSLPTARYYFKVVVSLNWRSATLDAGEADVKK